MAMHPMERLLLELRRCECCADGCDCGCVTECPRPEHRAVVNESTESGQDD